MIVRDQPPRGLFLQHLPNPELAEPEEDDGNPDGGQKNGRRYVVARFRIPHEPDDGDAEKERTDYRDAD